MTFRDLEARYRQLMMEQVAGRMPAHQFVAALGQLQCQDAQGRPWKLDAAGTWLVWDGRTWQQAAPALDSVAFPLPGGLSGAAPVVAAQPAAAYQAYPAAGQPNPAQPYPAQPYAQPYPAQPYPAQPYPAQPNPAHPYPHQEHPAQPANPYTGRSPQPPVPRSAPAIPGWLLGAEAQVQRLLAEHATGRMHPAMLAQALEQLKVQDARGVWWKPRGASGGWVAWNGQAWVDAPLPPGPAAPSGGAPSYATSAAAAADARLDLDAEKKKPIGQRSDKWWDLVAVVGGTLSGWVWFVYSAVRGMPQLKLFGPAQRESWFDFFPPMILLGIPILLLPFRRLVFKLLQKIPLPLKILGGLILAFVALTVQYDTFFLNQREGLDFITPLLMTGIPLLFTWFRGPIDRVLSPFQVIRRLIPRPLLVGAGLAIPFFTAVVLYYLFGINQYPLLRWNVFLGLVLSYLVLRTPKTKPSSAAPAGVATATLFLGSLALVLLCPGLAWADDFLRDPFNLNDGLRTPGIAVAISGLATTVVTVVINGIEVVRVFITPPPGTTVPGSKDAPPQQSAFVVVVRTVDATGVMSTTLDQQKTPAIFIYAHCEEVGKGHFPQGDPTIQFSLLSAQQVVGCQDLGTAHGERCAQVAFLPQLSKDVTIPPSCVVQVSAGAGGGLISAPVTLSLVADLILAAEVVNGERRLPIDPARPTFCVRYEPKTKEWRLGEVVLYFHTPDNDQPVRPPFQVLWQPITANPPYLEFDAPVSDDGGLTWRVHPKLLPGVKLPDDWLLAKGEIELDIGCTTLEGP